MILKIGLGQIFVVFISPSWFTNGKHPGGLKEWMILKFFFGFFHKFLSMFFHDASPLKEILRCAQNDIAGIISRPRQCHSERSEESYVTIEYPPE